MSNPVVYNWPILSTNNIVDSVQLDNGVENFSFNGSLSLGINYGSPIVLDGICREILITSAGDLSGIDFEIKGLYNNKPVTETITGPNNTTVNSANFFNTINSISVSGNMGASVSIGTGGVGVTNWFPYDNLRTFSNLAIACSVTADIDYTFQLTYDNVYGLTQDQEANIYITNPIANLTNATTSVTEYSSNPIRFCRIFINSSNNNGKGIFTLMQQGTT